MPRGRQALLLRAGIDNGIGGALAPIFADGSFEYVPVPETGPTRWPLIFARLPLGPNPLFRFAPQQQSCAKAAPRMPRLA